MKTMSMQLTMAIAAVAVATNGWGAVRAVTPTQWPGGETSWQMKRHYEKMATITNGGSRVVFIGDSITHGWEGGGAESWKKYFAGEPYKALNLGWGGDRTEHVLWRLTEGRELDGYEAKCILLMIGTNNGGHFKFKDEPPIDTIEGIRKILKVIAEKQPNARTILMPIFPREYDDRSEFCAARNAVVNKAICKMADGKKVIWCDFTDKFLSPEGRLSRELFPDLLHPNALGYEIWASEVIPMIDKVLSASPDAYIPSVWPSHPRYDVSGAPGVAIPSDYYRLIPWNRWWYDQSLVLAHRNEIVDNGTNEYDVVWVGDSITHRWYREGGEGRAVWAKLKDRYRMLNLGIGGDRVEHVLWRMLNGELEGYRAKTFAVMIGTNNCGRDVPGIARAIGDIVAVIRKRHPESKVVLMPIFPRGEKGNDALRVANGKVNEKIKGLADGASVVWLDFNDRFLTADGAIGKDVMSDYLHPTEKGYQIWYDAIEPLLANLCGKTCVALKAGESKVFDFGADGVGGYPAVTFDGTEGTARVRLVYATHPDGLGEKGDFWHETRATYMGPQLWLPILPANTDRFDVFEQTGEGTWRAQLAQGLVRYAKLTVESGAAKVRAVRFVNDGIHSEEPVVGSFVCSDERVNEVWKMSVRTCQLAAIPARTSPLSVTGTHTNAVLGTTYAYLSDGAKRDRLVWSGDLWFAQGNMYAAFASDSPYMPGSIRMLGENRTPDGYVQACPFPESHGPLADGDYGPFASDEFAAWFIPVLCKHVLHTGDLGLAREMRPVVRGLVAYLDRHTGKNGVFEQRIETCKHSCGLSVGGTSLHHRSYMNVLNWMAYRDAATLAGWLGDAADVASWTALAERTAQAVRTAFWDDAKGYLRLSLEDPQTMGFEANALALAACFATHEEAAKILPQLKHNWHGKFQLLAIRGAFAYGQGEKAMAYVAAHNWYKYLAPEWKGLKTIYECCGMGTRGWGDEAHPDACLAGDFTEYLLGVRPTSPGYAAYEVAPVPSGIASVEGSVPTPTGPVRVSVRDGHVRVTGNGGKGMVRWNGKTAVVPPFGKVEL